MHSIFSIIPRELIEAVGWTIFHSLWQGLAITLILGIVLLLFSKFSAHTRYIITFSSLIIMVVWSVFTFVKSYENANERAGIREQIISNPQLIIDHLKENLSKTHSPVRTTSAGNAEFQIKWIIFKSKIQKQFPFIVSIWSLGLLFFLCRFLGGLIITKQLRHRNTLPVNETWQKLTDDFINRLKIKKRVTLLQSYMAKVPLTIGYLKPVILLPVSVYTGLTALEIESIIAHELAHIARRDYFFNIIQSVIEILFFYHPAIWWISSITRNERENSCDDIAIELTGDYVNYAKALANMQEKVTTNPDLAMAFGNNKNRLFKRVKRLLNPRTMKTNFKEGFIASCILVTGILLIIVFSGASAKQNEYIKAPKDTIVVNSSAQPDMTISDDNEPESDKREKAKDNEECKKEVLKELENYELSDELEKELEVALNDLDDLTTYEVLRGVRGALNNMDINLIVHEALKGARAAVNNMDLNVIVQESIKDSDTCKEVDVDRITKEAIKGASAAVEEIDLNAIVNEVLKGVEGALDEIEVKKMIHESISEELRCINNCNSGNKYYSTISKGPYRWNRWRTKNPDELPDLSGIYLYKLNLQEINFSKVVLKDAVLDDSDLRNTDFTESNCEDIRIRETNLGNAVFENATFTDARFSENVMDYCNFRQTKLNDAIFKGCTLRYCDFEKADLRNVMFIGCKIQKCKFEGALANEDTEFPKGFNPEKHGIIFE